MVAQPISEPTLSLPANPVQQPDQESSKAQTPPMDPALTAPSPPHSENDVEQQLLPAHILGPAPTHPSLVHALPPPPPIVPITTPGSAIQPKFNSSPHLSGYRTTIKSSDLTPVNAPPRERKYKIVSATSHKDALPVLVGSPTNSGRHKRSAEEAELSEMDVDSEGRGSPLVMAPNSGAAAKTAEEIKREKNRESQRRSRQRKHQTLETFQTEVERLLREKEDMREQLLRERDEWKERALRAEARFPLQPSPEKESPPANLV